MSMSARLSAVVCCRLLFLLCCLSLICSIQALPVPSELQWGNTAHLGGNENFENGSVAVVSFNGVDQLFYRPEFTKVLVQCNIDDCTGTSTRVPIGVVGDGPGVTVSADGTRLHIFYVDDDSHRVRHIYQDTNGKYVVLAENDVQINVAKAPAAAVSGNANDNTICVVGPAAFGPNLVYSKRQETDFGYKTVSSGWTGFTQSSAASIVWWSGSYHAFFMPARGYYIAHIQSSDCITWKKTTNDYVISYSVHTFAGPAAFVLPASTKRDAELRILYRTDDRTLNQCASFDGINFQEASDPIEYNSMAGAAVAVWSPIGDGHVLAAGIDIYQSGSGSVYESIFYVKTIAIV